MRGLPALLGAIPRLERALDRRITRPIATVLLILIVGGSCGVALLWVFLTPIFQGPDEVLNDDYSFSILRAGHLLNVRDLPPGTSHPYTTYLADRSGGERMPFHPLVKAPPGYGSRAFFSALDAGRPNLQSAPDHTPFLVTRYPFGYFALVAAWLAVVSAVAGSGPVTLFFAARLLSVLMLAGTLGLGYAIARRLAVSRLRALALTAAIGFFPMTSFVASYAQADNLSWLLVSATWLAVLRAGVAPRLRDVSLVGLLLGALLVTKYQFFLCAAPPAVALLAFRIRRTGAAWPGTLRLASPLALPALLLGGVQSWVGYGSPFPLIGSSRENTAFWSDEALLRALHAGPLTLVRYALQDLVRGFIDYFAGGPTWRGFWGEFGWSDTILIIRSRGVSAGIRGVLLAMTLLLLLLVVRRLIQNARRLLGLRRAGRGRQALRIVLADPLTSTYLLFVLFMLSFYVFTDDSFYAQGRNWIPVLLPTFLLALLIAPRALGRRRAPVVSMGLLLGLLLFSAVGSHYALTTVRDRYYGNGRALVSAALPATEVGGGDLSHGIDYLLPDRVRPGEPLALGGWAGSTTRADGVLTVYVEIDGSGDLEAVYGDSRDDVVAATGARSLARAGFDLIVPTEGLRPGVHVLSLKVVLAGGVGYYRPPETRSFTVSGA